MSITYTHAGVSTLKGVTKVRFCNDQMRIKVLAKNGHHGIDIVQLKYPMTKADAVQYLMDINFDNGNATVRAALEAAAEKRGLTEKPEKTKTVAVPRATDVKAVAEVVTEDEDENAPF